MGSAGEGVAAVILADDLTGACDAGVHFARAGLRTFVYLAETRGSAEILSLNLRTRSQTSAEACAAMSAAAREFAAVPVLYKKIDSTLRGHVGAELEAVLGTGARASAVLTPAYPALGRSVRGGFLSAPGLPPLRVAEALAGTGLRPAATLQEALERPGSVWTPDAQSSGELGRIADAAFPFRDRLLFAGSGGLAREVAQLLAAGMDRKAAPAAQPPPAGGVPCLFIGSNHAATERQLRRLVASGLPHRLVRIRLENGATPSPEWRAALRESSAALFSGGETAQLVCSAFGVHTLELRDEVIPGVPLSTMLGGEFEGMAAATKAGGFGDTDALVAVVRALRGGLNSRTVP